MTAHPLTRFTCEATLPDGTACDAAIGPLPGTQQPARGRAKVRHGWARVADDNGLPIDVCPSCYGRHRREEAERRIEEDEQLARWRAERAATPAFARGER